MAHGTPDWGVTAGAVTTYQLTDLAELAARLGSIVTFDRRGDVIFLDDFEDGLKRWTSSISGLGAAVGVSSLSARSGAYAARLVAGSTPGREAELRREATPMSVSNTGLEFSWSFASANEITRLWLEVMTPTQGWRFIVRYDKSNNRLEFMDSGGGFPSLATGLPLVLGRQNFHTLKLVVDPVAGEYVRVRLDDAQYTPDPAGGFPVDVSASPYIRTWILNDGRAGLNDEILIDDVILTQNEPA